MPFKLVDQLLFCLRLRFQVGLSALSLLRPVVLHGLFALLGHFVNGFSLLSLRSLVPLDVLLFAMQVRAGLVMDLLYCFFLLKVHVVLRLVELKTPLLLRLVVVGDSLQLCFLFSLCIALLLTTSLN